MAKNLNIKINPELIDKYLPIIKPDAFTVLIVFARGNLPLKSSLSNSLISQLTGLSELKVVNAIELLKQQKLLKFESNGYLLNENLISA